jgi:hypothetical protein
MTLLDLVKGCLLNKSLFMKLVFGANGFRAKDVEPSKLQSDSFFSHSKTGEVHEGGEE